MILFLDFDGVLHRFPMDVHDKHFSQIEYLWKILMLYPDMYVVITSTWREKHSFENLVSMLTERGGENFASRFIGITPILEDNDNYFSGIRQVEVQTWLKMNNKEHEPYIILDDIEEYFSNDCKNLYLVDGSTGLNINDVNNLPLWISTWR